MQQPAPRHTEHQLRTALTHQAHTCAVCITYIRATTTALCRRLHQANLTTATHHTQTDGSIPLNLKLLDVVKRPADFSHAASQPVQPLPGVVSTELFIRYMSLPHKPPRTPPKSLIHTRYDARAYRSGLVLSPASHCRCQHKCSNTHHTQPLRELLAATLSQAPLALNKRRFTTSRHISVSSPSSHFQQQHTKQLLTTHLKPYAASQPARHTRRSRWQQQLHTE